MNIMLKLYICPSCRGTRFVSLENTTCYHCKQPMQLAPLPYAAFIQMEAGQREQYISDFIKCNLHPDPKSDTIAILHNYAKRIVKGTSKHKLPLYEQEPTSQAHLEDIIRLSTVRLFHG